MLSCKFCGQAVLSAETIEETIELCDCQGATIERHRQNVEKQGIIKINEMFGEDFEHLGIKSLPEEQLKFFKECVYQVVRNDIKKIAIDVTSQTKAIIKQNSKGELDIVRKENKQFKAETCSV